MRARETRLLPRTALASGPATGKDGGGRFPANGGASPGGGDAKRAARGGAFRAGRGSAARCDRFRDLLGANGSGRGDRSAAGRGGTGRDFAEAGGLMALDGYADAGVSASEAPPDGDEIHGQNPRRNEGDERKVAGRRGPLELYDAGADPRERTPLGQGGGARTAHPSGFQSGDHPGGDAGERGGLGGRCGGHRAARYPSGSGGG